MSTINIVRDAVLRRFVPACSSVLLSVLAAGALKNPQALTWAGVAVAASEVALLSAGFALVLSLAKGALPAAPRVLRRSLFAGFTAPFALGAASVIAQGATFPTILVLSLATGTAAGAFVAWLHRNKASDDPLLDPDVRLEFERLEKELASPTSSLGSGAELGFGKAAPNVNPKTVAEIRQRGNAE